MSIVMPIASPAEPWGERPAYHPIPFADFKPELLGLYEPPQRAKATYAKMRQTLEILAGLVGNGTTADLSPALITRFIQARPAGTNPNTTIGLLRNVRAVCNYAVERGYLRANPMSCRKTWLRPVATGGKQHHGADEIARVLDLARRDIARKKAGSWAQWRARRLYALAATVAYTGVRKMEALRLRAEDIDIPGRMIHIVERGGSLLKTEGSAQPVPMPDALAAILAEWLPFLALPEAAEPPSGEGSPGGPRRPDPGWVFPNAYRTLPWTGGSPGQKPLDRLKRLGKRAGVEGFTFLSLRHSWATHAESLWGFSEAMIQRVLRHTDRQTQQHYRHADPANLRAAVKGLSFGDAPPPLPPAPARPAGDAAPPRATGKPPRGPRLSAPKLDDEDIAEARRLREGGWSYPTLAARFGVSRSTLHAALNGKTHKHLADAGDGADGRDVAP